MTAADRSESASFCAALRDGNRPALQAFPKADRHCHSLFGAGLPGIRSWTGADIKDPPARMADFDEMRAYAHAELYPFINHRAGFEHTAAQAVREAEEDGVRILEMSLDIRFARCYPGGIDAFVAFARELSEASRPGIQFRPEIGVSKNRDPAAEVPLARECVDSGVFSSIDLYGNERAREPEAYAELYRRAAARGLKLKAHVGEFADASLVERTLRVLGLHEVQHGVTAAASPSLMRLLRREGIRLNVCPSSNVALSVAEDLASHPIRVLVQEGVRVSVNSDDKTIFGKTVTEEYLGLYAAGTLGAEELDAIRRDALRE